MKRFVVTILKDWAAVLTIGLLVAMLIFETGKALVFLFLLVVTGVPFYLYEDPPGWLLRSPLGRWLHR
jgi:hypothetical protein